MNIFEAVKQSVTNPAGCRKLWNTGKQERNGGLSISP